MMTTMMRRRNREEERKMRMMRESRKKAMMVKRKTMTRLVRKTMTTTMMWRRRNREKRKMRMKRKRRKETIMKKKTREGWTGQNEEGRAKWGGRRPERLDDAGGQGDGARRRVASRGQQEGRQVKVFISGLRGVNDAAPPCLAICRRIHNRRVIYGYTICLEAGARGNFQIYW